MKLRYKVIGGIVILFTILTVFPFVVALITGHHAEFEHCEGSVGVYVDCDNHTGECGEIAHENDWMCIGK